MVKYSKIEKISERRTYSFFFLMLGGMIMLTAKETLELISKTMVYY
jgi:hypothetical protein